MIIKFNFLVASFLVLLVFLTSTDSSGDGRPVFLTPYIERGMISRAQREARATPLIPLLDNIRSYSGYLTVDKSTDSHMFFWYFPPLKISAQPDEIPVILWLQGGPGVSSMYGALRLNGPYRLELGKPLTFNNYTWANHAHMLYIDNPVGTGFSFTRSSNGYSRNETHVGHNLYLALIQFFKLFPNLQRNPLIIAGESYAGKYLLALGMTIHKNNPKADLKLNLQGISIGNGWIDPINMMDFGDVMFYNGLLDTKGRKLFNAERDKVLKYLRAGDLKRAYPIYDRWILGDTTPYPTLYDNLTGIDSYYNIMLMGKSPPEAEIFDEFFNTENNRLKLNAGNRKFRHNSKKVAKYLRDDILTSIVDWLAVLMENYRVLIYNGQLDIKCAYALTENSLNMMKWNGAKEFKEADRQHYYIDGELAGYVKTVRNFTQILIRNSGHMVPRDQAKWAEQMIYTFAYNLPFVQDTETE
uniref:Carboxypeptidase n=1 Tax=Lygus hesperus TaxID=30085 RepID=A0A0K8SZ92_LYGHE